MVTITSLFLHIIKVKTIDINHFGKNKVYYSIRWKYIKGVANIALLVLWHSFMTNMFTLIFTEMKCINKEEKLTENINLLPSSQEAILTNISFVLKKVSFLFLISN